MSLSVPVIGHTRYSIHLQRRPAFSNLAAVAPIAQHLMKLGTAEFRRRVLDYAPLSAVRQLKHAVDSMTYHSVKIYTEKKAANTMSQGTNATEDGADAILAALSKNLSLRICGGAHSSICSKLVQMKKLMLKTDCSTRR